MGEREREWDEEGDEEKEWEKDEKRERERELEKKRKGLGHKVERSLWKRN